MKISVNDVELFTLSETQKLVIANDIPASVLEEDLKQRLQWSLMSKYDACYKRLFDEWFPKLADRGVQSIPTDKDAFAQLVFSQPDYLDRAGRDALSQPVAPEGE
jgi:hypothetical protein